MSEKKRRRWFPRWRKMTWLLLAWTALILVWVIAGSSSTDESVADCVADSGGLLTEQDCRDAVDAGEGIGIMIVLFFGAVIFLVLLGVWFATRPRDDATRELAREMRLAREERERAAHHSVDT